MDNLKLYAVEIIYKTGYSGHADYNKVMFAWCTTPEEAIVVAKANECYEEGYYEYDCEEINLDPHAEPEYVFYHSKA